MCPVFVLFENRLRPFSVLSQVPLLIDVEVSEAAFVNRSERFGLDRGGGRVALAQTAGRDLQETFRYLRSRVA